MTGLLNQLEELDKGIALSMMTTFSDALNEQIALLLPDDQRNSDDEEIISTGLHEEVQVDGLEDIKGQGFKP